MSGGAALRPLLRVRGAQQASGHVLAGVLLDGEAVQQAAFLDPVFLAEAGWDPARRVLSLPAGHALLGCGRCKAAGCQTTAYASGVCPRCRARLNAAGGAAGAEAPASDPPPPAAPRGGPRGP